MIFLKRSFHAFPHRFISLDNANVFCLANLFNATGFPVPLTLKFARHCGWHRNFQLSTRAFHDVFEFSNIRINELNTTQFRGIIELRFLDRQLLLFFAFRRIGTYLSKSLATKCRVLRSFVFSSVSPSRPCISIQWIFVQYSEYCETCPHI